jgi:hypothetical protein
VGRWLGYTTAVLFALLSLYQISKTFKRVLLFQVYMHKSPVEQDEMITTLANQHNTAGPRMLARVMSTMQPASRSNESCVLGASSNSNEAFSAGAGHGASASPFEFHTANPSSTLQLRRRSNISHTVIMPVRALGVTAQAPSGHAHTIHHLPSSSKSPGEIQSYTLHSTGASCGEFPAYPLHHTGSSDGSRAQQRSNTVGRVQDALGITSSLEKLKEDREDSLCVSIAQNIQRLEVGVLHVSLDSPAHVLQVQSVCAAHDAHGSC